MQLRGITSWLDRRGWLDGAADALQPAVKGVFGALGPARRDVKNFLHGTWLGHPLHPVMTDIPLGAWTATLLLDAMGDRSGRSGVARAADASLALGLAGALGSAVTVQNHKGEKETYTIVGFAEADPKEHRISNESPVGHALLGKAVGDEVQVQAPAGTLRWTILSIN